MTKLVTYKDGRLRTRRIAVLLFILMMGCAVILFELKKPMSQAIVSVKHVFEPKVRPDHKDEIKEKKPVQAAKKLPKENNDSAGKVADPEKHVAVKPSDAVDKTEPVSKPMNVEDMPQKAMEVSKTEPPRMKNQGSPVEVESVRNDQHDAANRIKSKEPEKSVREREPVRLDISKRLKEIWVLNKSDEAKKEIDLSAGLEKITEKNRERKRKEADVEARNNSRDIKVNQAERSITVSSETYLDLFKGWRSVGAGPDGSRIVPLRVENLKSAYSLFQMKPVAVVGNRYYYDLSDGTRIPEASLGEYASTVFRVKNPWKKWREGLSASGIRETDSIPIEVRYYMYGFVKNAIYARANRAVSWGKETGRLNNEAPISNVDVLGRAFVIKQQGGGRFGVFVPISLNTSDGQTIPIDPSCFADQPDVQALQVAGLL